MKRKPATELYIYINYYYYYFLEKRLLHETPPLLVSCFLTELALQVKILSKPASS